MVSKKAVGKKPKPLSDAPDAPIQFGVPSELRASAEPVANSDAAMPTGDVTGDALDLPELAEALDMTVEALDDSAVEALAVEAAIIEPMVDVATALPGLSASPLDMPPTDTPIEVPTTDTAAIAPVALEIAPIDLSRVELAAPIPHAAPETPATTNATKDLPMDETINTTAASPAGMMNGAAETMKNAASEMQSRGAAMMGDMSGRAKSAMERGTKAVEDLVEFQTGNLEAMMSSGRVAGSGAQEIAKYSAEYGRSTIEKANAAARQFATVKSPTEFFQLQGDFAKQMLDGMVAEGAKFTESYMKLMGEVAQPLSNRVAVAVDKAKTTMGNQG